MCPPGTYKNETGSRYVGDCDSCPAGYFCPYNGSDISFPCTNGTYCPNGTIHPEWCEAGFYCPEARVKIPCPSGYYCPNATVDKIPCPTGHYCPGVDNCMLTEAGAIIPTICPLGMLSVFFFVFVFISFFTNE